MNPIPWLLFRHCGASLAVLSITLLVCEGVFAQTYDVSQGFSTASNPHGPWSYGWVSTVDGPFTLLSYEKNLSSENGVPISAWQVSDPEQPSVARVMGGATAISAGGTFVAAPGQVYFAPGADGTPRNFGVIRFTVPGGGGNYRLETSVVSEFSAANSSDCDFHVVRNGQELFGQFLPPNSGTGYTNTVHLAAGDTVDFDVGKGADGIRDNAGLKIQATLTALSSDPLPGVPAISSFFPAAGPIGTSVVITGTNFGATAPENLVYFGPVRATVTAASTTSLTATVPLGATYTPPCVTAGGLTACASAPFVVTFPSSGVIDADTLAPRLDLPGGDGPMQVVIADLDGDGKPDLAMVSRYDSVLSLYRNISASGSLTADSFGPRVTFQTTLDPVHLVVADVDGDGKLDLVVVNHVSGVVAGGTDTVSVFRNTTVPGGPFSTNSLAPKIDYPTGQVPQHVAVGDLDGDGRPEVAVANFGSGTISVFKNLSSVGAIDFAPKIDLTADYGIHSVEIGDLDGDGKPELVAANHQNDTTSVLRNISPPGIISQDSFAPKVDFAGGGKTIAIGDLDGDGKPDLVVGSWRIGRLSIFRNTSAPGSFTSNSLAPKIELPADGFAHTVVIGDLDGDGRPDLALVTEMPSHLSLFQNLSSGSLTTNSFAPAIEFGTGWNAAGVAVGDLDGDGKPDVVFANHYDDSITIYRNTLPVDTAPIILEQPQDQVVAAGSDVLFRVRAKGAPAPTYQWFFNDALLSGETLATLTVTNAQPSNTGGYSVVASNSFGSVTSRVATLTVVPSRTLALTSPAPAQEGSSISVPLELTSEGDVGGMTFLLRYDPTYLRNAQLSWSPVLDGLFSTINDSTPGQIEATFEFSGDAIPAGTRLLATASFLLRSVPDDLDTPLTVEIEDVSNPAGDPITVGNLTRDASAHINKRSILGDNNANQRLDVGDATVILRFLTHLDTPRDWDVSGNDLNLNQSLDSGDAIKVLRVAAGVDPQPGDSGGAPLQPTKVSAAASLSLLGERMLLSPATQRGVAGDLVTFQVRLQDVTTAISGASFTLDYPTNALRLLGSSSYHFGSLVPAGALAVWNVSPAQNNFTIQDGHLSLAVSSAAAWPASNGVLAEIAFQVQTSATNQYLWPLVLRRCEITPDGFGNRLLFPSGAVFISRDPLPGILAVLERTISNHFQFSFTGDAGAAYVVEASTNLLSWTRMTDITNSTGSLIIADPDSAKFPHRFYRLRPAP
jgi:hypothetical protein